MVAFCSSEATLRAVQTIQQHLLSSMSVPTLPMTAGSP
jgi:hypothetical protein